MIPMSKFRTIGIVGSRRRDTEDDYNKVLKAFFKLWTPGDRIVSGGCPEGGDRFAELIALRHQVPIMIHYAAWNRIGDKAGFERNTDIANDADILIACVAPDRTGGTEDTIKKFQSLKKGRVIFV